MKRKKAEKPGGIYKPTRIKGTWKSPAKMKAAFAAAKAAFADWQDLDGQLDRIGREAERLLETEPPEAMAIDAAELLRLLGGLREHLAKSDARSASLASLHVGATCERLRIRPFEPLVVHGRKTLEAAAGARKARTTKARKQHEEFLQRVAVQREHHPHATKTTIQQNVANDMGIKWSTMYARLRRYSE